MGLLWCSVAVLSGKGIKDVFVPRQCFTREPQVGQAHFGCT